MNAYLQKIQTYLDRFKKNDFVYTKERLDAVRDWNILLFFVCIAIIVITAYSSYIYSQVSNGTFSNIQSSTESEQTVTINEQLLNTTVQRVATKSATFDSLQKNKLSVPDPSL